MKKAQVVYPFPQDRRVVSYAFKRSIEVLERSGLSKNTVFELYYKERTRMSGTEQLSHEYDFELHTTEELSHNEAIHILSNIPVIEFLSQYYAYYERCEDDSGLDNGMVYQQIESKMKASTQNILIEPPVHFVAKCLNDHVLRQSTLTFMFSDIRLATLYQSVFVSENCNWIATAEIAGIQNNAQIVYWGTALTADELQRNLVKLREVISDLSRVKLHLMLPAAYLNKSGRKSTFRKSLISNYSIQKVLIIEPIVVHTSPKKRIWTTLSAGCTPEKVKISRLVPQYKKQSANPGKSKKIISSLICTPAVFVSYEDFLNSGATLSAIYQRNISVGKTRENRKAPQVYKFSLEIEIWYSIERAGKKLRGKYHFYDFPSSRQANENLGGRGSPLISGIVGKTCSTEAEITAYAEDLPLSNEKLAKIIRSAVSKKYGTASVSLKTFWYLHEPVLQQIPGYSHDICQMLFCGPHSYNEPLCALVVGECDVDDVRKALANYMSIRRMDPMSKKRIDEIWSQVDTIFTYAIHKGIICQNPMQDLIQKRDQWREDLNSTRENLVNTSFSIKQEAERQAIAPIECSGVHLGYLLCAMGLNTGVVCAFTLGDVITHANYSLISLKITKHIIGNSREATAIPNPRRHIVFPIPEEYTQLFLQWIREKRDLLSKAGIPEDLHDDFPLLTGKNLKEGLTPRVLNEYCSKIISQIQSPSMKIKIPITREVWEETDLNKPGRSMLKSNFEFMLNQYSLMTPDEIAYCRGTKPVTVAGNNYCDFANSAIQLILRTKMERALSKINSKLALPEPIRNAIKIGIRKAKHIFFAPCNEGSELVVDLELPGCDDGTVLDLSVLAEYGAQIYVDIMERS